MTSSSVITAAARLLVLSLLGLVLIVPSVSQGQDCAAAGDPLACAKEVASGAKLETDLKPVGFIGNVINLFLGLVGIIAVGVIVYAGGMMILSFGDDNRFAKAKKTILYAVLGLVIVIFSAVIVNFVLNAAKAGASKTPSGGYADQRLIGGIVAVA